MDVPDFPDFRPRFPSPISPDFPDFPGANFRDITSGFAGRFSAATGWNFTTGVGSNLGLHGK
jgi:hypothetical protein